MDYWYGEPKDQLAVNSINPLSRVVGDCTWRPEPHAPGNSASPNFMHCTYRAYKKAKDHNRNTTVRCPYFDEFNTLLQGKANAEPVIIVDSLQDAKQENSCTALGVKNSKDP